MCVFKHLAHVYSDSEDLRYSLIWIYPFPNIQNNCPDTAFRTSNKHLRLHTIPTRYLDSTSPKDKKYSLIGAKIVHMHCIERQTKPIFTCDWRKYLAAIHPFLQPSTMGNCIFNWVLYFVDCIKNWIFRIFIRKWTQYIGRNGSITQLAGHLHEPQSALTWSKV